MTRSRRVVLERVTPASFDPPTVAVRGEAVVHVDPQDPIESVLRAIRMAGSPRVALVVAHAAPALGTFGRLAMLAYFLREEGYEATIVTSDPRLAGEAQENGIAVRAGVALPDSPARTPLREPPIFERIGDQDLRTIVPRSVRTMPDTPLIERLPLGRIGAIIIAVLAAYLAVVYFVLPGSTVVVTPIAEFVPIVAVVRVDPDAGTVDLDRGLIPAVVVEATVEDSLSKPTTGRRREAESFGTGFVTLRNRTREALLVPRGTAVRSADDTAFLTDAEVLVPPTLRVGGRDVPGEAIVAVTAERPGLAGNLPSLSIATVDPPLAAVLEPYNPQPLTGGAEREVALVGQRDRDELAAVLHERLQSAAVETLRRERGENQTLVVWSPESGNPQVISENFTAAVDERAPLLTLTLALRASGTVYENADLEQLLRHQLQTRLGTDAASFNEIRVVESEVVAERLGILELRVRAVAQAVTTVKADAIRDALAGRSLDEGQAVLAGTPDIAGFTVTHDPPNTGNFPRIPFRIDVQIAPPRAVTPG